MSAKHNDSFSPPLKKGKKTDLELGGAKLSQLARISQIIGSDLDLPEVLKRVADVTAELMGSKICSVLYHDEDKATLRILATQSLSELYQNKPPVSVSKSVSGRAITSLTPQIVPDVREDESFGYRELAVKEGIVSLLCVPMVVKGKAIGTLNSYTSHIHKYTEDEVSILSMIASQAAIAIENAQLHQVRAEAEKDLDKKKVLRQAKLVLMKQKSFDEPAAHRYIQKQSMNLRKPILEIAQRIIDSKTV